MNTQPAARPTAPRPSAIHIRWMIRRDMTEVLAIERAVFESPWTEEDFHDALCKPNQIGMVAEECDRVVGYMVYTLQTSQIELLNLAVDPQRHRRGVGSAMLAKLQAKLSSERRKRLGAYVRETNLPAQLFFQSQGFRATAVVRGFYEAINEDAYRFVFRVK